MIEINEQVTRRCGRRPTSGNIQGSEQLDLAVDIPAHCRGVRP